MFPRVYSCLRSYMVVCCIGMEMTVKAFLLRRYVQRVDPEHKGRGSRVLAVSFFKDHISLGSMHNV